MTRSDDESSYAQGSIHSTLYTYESALNRIQSVTYPDGGQTTYTYPSAREVDSTRLATPDPSISSQAIADSYGRPFQVVQAGVSSETSYDLNGRVFCITNPHFVGSSSTTDGSTCTTQYDGLSRPTVQTQPDGSTLGWSYRGNVTTSTDEGGHSWQQTTDALGRLLNVTEPTGASTGYIYDLLNNLRTMNQLGLPGEVPRVRGFVYDSLSRLTSATNPESGTVGYGYDANGNMINKTDARGVTTTFVYDLLNRLTAKTSSDGSVHYEYLYDVSGAPNGVGRLSHSSNDINAAAARSYDAMGRIIKQQYCIPSDCPSYSSQVNAQYDLAGNLISLTYPDGRVVNQTWDSGGHLSSVTDAIGAQYLTPQSTYNPDGSSLTIWRGNGVASGFERNSRQQPWAWNVARIDANAPGNRGLLLKEACYGPATPSPSPNAVPACPSFGIGNNGNIWSIIDGSVSGHTQTYSYDSLNRLSTMIQADAGMQQTYQYDSFGNLNQVFPATLGGSVGVLPNNQIQGIGYDGAGNAAVYDNGLFTTTYAYDAENQLTNVNNGAAVYTYDADGNRVRKDTGGQWTEYIHFNGQTMAEKNDDGTWSDYIFANGQRLARADNYDIRIRMSGTNCSGCSSTNTFAGTQSLTNANGTVIRPGDLLTWRQYQDGVGRGGISVAFSNNTVGSSGVLRALDGELTDADTRTNNWYQRVADLSPYAGLTVSNLNLYNYQGGAPGNWDIYLGDISLVHTDGTFVPIYDRTMMGLAQFTPGAAESSVSVITEKAPDSSDPLNTAYYHYDQVGSVLFMTDAGGWPISSDSYYPFGQAGGPVPLTTPGIGNHYKFTGQERDSESGLDNFNARYHLSALGRFMSPDPYNGSFDLSNPQSFNRYVYVNDRPLTSTDPTGLFILPPGPTGALCGPCAGIIAGAGAIYDLGKLLGWWGGSGFHGTLTPRPEGTGTPDWNNPWSEHIGLPAGGPAFGGGGLGGLLGLPSTACEFGACGAGPSSFQAAGGAVAGTIVCQLAEPCGAIEDSLLVIGAAAIAGIDAYNIYRGRTNVADTGITSEAQQLVSSGKFPSICAALAFLQSTTRDSARLQKIKATQKAFGCRRNSTQS
nr:RHS repeat-associated core domain-containing protein [Granulicella sp. dw_53]